MSPSMFNGSMDDPLHNTIVGTILQGDGRTQGTDLDNGVVSDEATWTGVDAGRPHGALLRQPRHAARDQPRRRATDVGDPWTNPPPAQETNPAAFSRLSARAGVPPHLRLDPDPLDGRRVRAARRHRPRLPPHDAVRLRAQQPGAEPRSPTSRSSGRSAPRTRRCGAGTRTRLWVDASFYAYGRVDGADIVVAAFNLGRRAGHAGR